MTSIYGDAAFSVKRFVPLGIVVLLHAAFFHALQSGLLREAMRLLPNETLVMLSMPEPERPEPPKLQPMPQIKPVPVVKKIAPAPAPRQVAEAPSPIAFEAPQPVEPAATAILPALAAPPAPPAPPAPVVTAQPKTISSGVEYLQPPRADYPAFSKRRGEEGKVVLRVLVNETGRPQQANVVSSSGSSRLDEAAHQAVMRALFKPHVEGGRAVAVYVLVPINFQLNS